MLEVVERIERVRMTPELLAELPNVLEQRRRWMERRLAERPPVPVKSPAFRAVVAPRRASSEQIAQARAVINKCSALRSGVLVKRILESTAQYFGVEVDDILSDA